MHALLFFIDFFPLPLPPDMPKASYPDSDPESSSGDELLIRPLPSNHVEKRPNVPNALGRESSTDELVIGPHARRNALGREPSGCELLIGPQADSNHVEMTPNLPTALGSTIGPHRVRPSVDRRPPTLPRRSNSSSKRPTHIPRPATSRQIPPSRSPSPDGFLIEEPAPPIDLSTPTTPRRSSQGLPKLVQTPGNRGPSSQFDFKEHYHRNSVDLYVDEDLKSSRVFLPTDTFLHVLLGLPKEWGEDDAFTNLINKVMCDDAYRECRNNYQKVCLPPSIKHESLLYDDYLDMCNTATGIFVQDDKSETSKSLWSYRQDKKYLRGSNAQRSPDGLGVSQGLWKSSGNAMRTGKGPENNFGWPHAQYFSDLKPIRTVLDRGSTSPYAVLDIYGMDRRDMKDLRDASERFEKRTGVSSVGVLNTKKRGSQSTAGMPSAKRSKTRSAIDAIVASGGETVSSIMTEPTDDSQTRRGVSRQCARYALEVLSSAGFRSHCFGLLVGVNEIQVLYYDRSIIAVSEPFPMVNLKEPDGLDCEDERRFVALLICLHRATLAQRGIMENLMPDPFLEVYQKYTDNMANDPKTLFDGKKIKLQVGGKAVLVTLGLVLMRQPGIIGRNTCVVEGTSDEWPGMDLVVKISWPPSSRVSENTFVEQIKAAVEAQEDVAWVLDHIPTILHSQDFHLQPDSPGSKLREYLSGPDVKFVDDKAFYYEHRVCRVSVHERLYRLDALTTPEDYAQVIFDVYQVHRWIYDHPRIIHRDLSQGNIMWHKRRNRICGVLNDFDLSSSRDTIGASSKQRTGTRPFMAHELHALDANGNPPVHLYRHDLESIFYLIVLLTCAYALKKVPSNDGSYLHANKSSPYHSWFSMTDDQLYKEKHAIISTYNARTIPVPDNSFKDFAVWIRPLHKSFGLGMTNRNLWDLASPIKDEENEENEEDEDSEDSEDSEEEHNNDDQDAEDGAGDDDDDDDEDEEDDEDEGNDATDVDDSSRAHPVFDEETMGGAVTYDAVLAIMKTFGRIRRSKNERGKKGRVKNGRSEKRSLEMMYPIAKKD